MLDYKQYFTTSIKQTTDKHQTGSNPSSLYKAQSLKTHWSGGDCYLPYAKASTKNKLNLGRGLLKKSIHVFNLASLSVVSV